MPRLILENGRESFQNISQALVEMHQTTEKCTR